MVDATCTFRSAISADLEVLREFILAFHVEDGHPIDELSLARATQAVAAGEPQLRVWMIDSDGSSVGYVALGLGFSIEVGGIDAFLDELYLAPTHRSHGFGRRALAFVEQESIRLGVRRLCLEVETRNSRARSLYAAQGYIDHSRHLMSKLL